MVDSSAPASDDGESRRRLSSTKSFLSHLHENQGAKRVGGRAHQSAIVDGNSSDAVSAGDHPLVSSRKGAGAGPWRGSRVSFGDVEVQGDDDANRTTGRQAARGDDRSSLSSCAASNDAVAHLSKRRDITPRRTPSLTTPNEAVPDSEFTFRCSSKMPPTPSQSSLPGIDLVGTVICAHNESPVSSLSSHRFSGKSTSANDGEVLDSWLRQTHKLRASVVLAKGGKEGSPIVPKSFIELAKIRREREAIEESDSMSSLSTSDNDSDDDSGGGESEGLGRLPPSSLLRPALPLSPRVSFKSGPSAKETLFGHGSLTPVQSREALEESDSGLTSKYRKPDGNTGSHGGRSKATKVPARALMTSPPRLALEVSPRVSFKTTSVMPKSPRRDAGRKRPQARVVRDDYKGQTAKKKFGAASAHRSNGDASPASARGIPNDSPPAVQPRVMTSARTATKAAEPAKVVSRGTSSESKRGSPVLPSLSNAALEGAAVTVSATTTNSDTAASVGITAECERPGAPRSAGGGDRTESGHAGSLTNGDSLSKSSTSASHDSSAACETSDMAHRKGKNTSSTAVEEVARENRAKIPLPPGEAAVPKSPRDETASAGIYIEAAHFPASKGELQDMTSRRAVNGNQDAIESQPEPTGGKAGTLGGMAGGIPWTTTQRRMAIVNIAASVVEHLMVFDARLQHSGGAAKPPKRAASILSESTVEGHDSDSDSSGTGNEGGAERTPAAVLGRSAGPLRPEKVEHHSRMRERQNPQPQEIAKGAEIAEKGGDEKARGGRQVYAVPPPPSEDESGREKYPVGDGDDDHAVRERRNADPSAESTTAVLVKSSSQAGPHAHFAVDSRETTSGTMARQDSSQPKQVAAEAVSAANPDLRLGSSPYTFLLSPPLSARNGNDGGRNKTAASRMTRQEALPHVSSRKGVRRHASGKSRREPPLTPTRAAAEDPWRARIHAEVTATLANRGNDSRSAAFSPAEMACRYDGGSDCGDNTLKRGKSDSALSDCRRAAPTENPRSSAARDSSGVSVLQEAVASIPTGQSKESSLTAWPAEQSRMDGRPEACGGSRTNRDAPARRTIAEMNVVEGGASMSQAKRSLGVAYTSSMEKLAAVSTAEETGSTRREPAWDDGRLGKGGAERVASASRRTLSRRESAILPDRWSIRILAEAAATLARCGIAGRSVAVSLAKISSVRPACKGSGRRRHTSTSSARPAFQGSGQRRHTGTETTRPGGATGGRCSATSVRRQPPSLTIAQRRSKVGVAATSAVHRWMVCGSGPSSELPMIVDFGSISPGFLTCVGSGERKCGPGSASCDRGGSLYRRQRGEAVTMAPIRPRGSCDSRASLSSGSFVAGGGQGADVNLGVHDHVVGVSRACRNDGGADESGGAGCVSRGRRRRSPLPTPQKSKRPVPAAFRGWECPVIVDSGSLHTLAHETKLDYSRCSCR